MRFALDAAGITALISGLAFITGLDINPVFFLILLYLITMRVRLLVDLGTVFARQGKYSQADKLYTLASRLWPDATGTLVLKVNQATLRVQENKLDEAVAIFTEVLQQADQGRLGVKYEAAAHFNLGVAYLRKDLPGRARIEFNAVITTWPVSLYAHRAQEALERQRARDGKMIESQPDDH